MTQGLQTTKTKETPNARKVEGNLIEEKNRNEHFAFLSL